MLTPQDIQNKEFTKAVFGGYDMAVVDDFLEEVMNDYASLYKENGILKSKIKVLVEKVEEYRSTEDAMRMALLTAQKMGDELLAEAKQKSQTIVSDADAAAKNKLQEIQDNIAREESRLTAAQEKTRSFIQRAEALLIEQQHMLDTLKEMVPSQMPPQEKEEAPQTASVAETQREAEIQETADQISGAVSKMTDSVPTPPPQKPEPKASQEDLEATKVIGKLNWDEDDEPVSPRPKFDFSDLKFGSNYTDSADK